MTRGLLGGMFLFVRAAVSAAGYVFVLRPSRNEAPEVEIPAGISLEQQDLPAAQAAFVGAFRLLGEALPNSGKHEDVRRQLITAGHPWPSAGLRFFGNKGGAAPAVRGGAGLGAMAHQAAAHPPPPAAGLRLRLRYS